MSPTRHLKSLRGDTPGYPCVDLSSLNHLAIPFDEPLSATGGTQQTILKYVRKKPPAVLVFENVPKIAARRSADARKKKAPPVVQQDQELMKHGYMGKWFMLNTKCYGLAQSRLRAYVVYFHAARGDCEKLTLLLNKCRVGPKPLSDCIVEDASPTVQDEGRHSRRGVPIFSCAFEVQSVHV